jgi:hypothetical protein
MLFTSKPPKEKDPTIDQEIVKLLRILKTLDPTVDDEKYRKVVERISALYQMKGIKTSRSVSTEVLLGIAAQFGITLLVLYFEQTGSITSKAFGFIKGGRV